MTFIVLCQCDAVSSVDTASHSATVCQSAECQYYTHGMKDLFFLQLFVVVFCLVLRFKTCFSTLHGFLLDTSMKHLHAVPLLFTAAAAVVGTVIVNCCRSSFPPLLLIQLGSPECYNLCIRFRQNQVVCIVFLSLLPPLANKIIIKAFCCIL